MKDLLRYAFMGEALLPSEERATKMLKDLFNAPVEGYFHELRHSGILDALKRANMEDRLSKNRKNLGMIDLGTEACVLYSIVRALKPKQCLETGVGSGASTSVILEALRMNGEGRLTSIDDLRFRGGLGGSIPEHLKNPEVWSLRIGATVKMLHIILDDISPIDFFLQDTLHTYENVTFELETVRPRMNAGGLIFVDDTNYSNAFADFCLRLGRKPPMGRFDRFGFIRL